MKSLSKLKHEKVDKIQLQWSEKEGRFGIAKNEIKCGEIVLADEPTIAFPHVISNSYCDFCLSSDEIISEGRAYKKVWEHLWFDQIIGTLKLPKNRT